MERETRGGPRGCVIALAVVGALAIGAMIMASGVGYFVYSVFKTRQVLEKTRAARADASYAASVSAKAAMPRLTALPPPITAMSADKTIIRDETLNFEGDYKPKTPVASGKYVLSEIDLGGNGDFGEFEHGGGVQGASPLVFVFEAPSEKAAGRNSPPSTIRVVATAYRLTRERIQFSAHDARVGDVGFAGTIDPAFLVRLDDPNHTQAFEDSAVMTGDLTVSGQVIKGIGFSYLLNDPSED